MKSGTVIAVRGSANRGKTTSIQLAYSLLRDLYPAAEVEELNIGSDITVVITINGVKVGIESRGDPNSRLFESLNHFVRIGCKVIVCSTRSRGSTVEAVKALDEKYHVEWYSKHAASSERGQTADNHSFAQQIAKAVQAAIRM